MEKKGIGDIHTHQINKEAVPDNLSRQQTKGYSEGFLSSIFGQFFGRLIYGRNFKEFYRILKSATIPEVAQRHIEAMENAGINYSIVLSLDFSEVDPKYKKYNISYTQQMKDIAANCAAYPFRLFQFFCFEPRREGVQELLEEAHEHYGIVGIKIYPAYGFDPRPEKDDFLPGRSKPKSIRENLEFLYTFAEKNNLPILTHCSPGGSFLCTVKREERYKMIYPYTEPSNFLGIAQRYKLRICFAHMGGSIYARSDQELATQWSNQIYNLIKYADNDGLKSGSRFYTDQSNFLAHVSRRKKERDEHLASTNQLLNPGAISKYLIFGSDWPLARFKLDEEKYINYYWDEFIEAKRNLYFWDNIAEFIFGPKREIPEYNIKFIERANAQIIIPDWITVEMEGERKVFSIKKKSD